MNRRRGGIGCRAWWGDPTWREDGTPKERRHFVLNKLEKLDFGAFKDTILTTLSKVDADKVEPDDIAPEQWMTILRDMGAADHEVRQVMSHIDFGGSAASVRN